MTVFGKKRGTRRPGGKGTLDKKFEELLTYPFVSNVEKARWFEDLVCNL